MGLLFRLVDSFHSADGIVVDMSKLEVDSFHSADGLGVDTSKTEVDRLTKVPLAVPGLALKEEIETALVCCTGVALVELLVVARLAAVEPRAGYCTGAAPAELLVVARLGGLVDMSLPAVLVVWLAADRLMPMEQADRVLEFGTDWQVDMAHLAQTAVVLDATADLLVLA